MTSSGEEEIGKKQKTNNISNISDSLWSKSILNSQIPLDFGSELRVISFKTFIDIFDVRLQFNEKYSKNNWWIYNDELRCYILKREENTDRQMVSSMKFFYIFTQHGTRKSAIFSHDIFFEVGINVLWHR